MRSVLWFLTPLLAPGVVAAQSDSVPHTAPRTCWRGKPAPQCQTFWLTEISGAYAFVSTTAHYRQVYQTSNGPAVVSDDRPDITSRLVWTVGPMFNTSPRHAVGGTITAGFVDGGQRIAVEARRRNWFPERGFALDLSAGPLRQSVPFHEGTPAYGLTAGAYVIGEDLINVNAHADVLFTNGRVRTGATLGIGAGSKAAVGVTALLGALTVALIALVANAHWD